MAHSVLIIREAAEQLTGSDCCGVLRGDFARDNGKPIFAEAHNASLKLSAIGGLIRKQSGKKIDLKYIDPRNQLYLIPKLCRDVMKYRPPFLQALKTMFQFFSCPAIIINGVVVDGSTLTASDEIEIFFKDL